MPTALLVEFDFTQGLPMFIKDQKYDFIISTYALHHLNDNQKLDFLNDCKSNLNDDGTIIIGDVGFQTQMDLIQCRENHLDIWDDDEHYLIYENIKEKLIYKTKFKQLSFCGCVLQLK